MSKYAATEITSAEIPSDNPVHQRLYFPYMEAAKIIYGNVLELGCGWGRGVETLIQKCDHYTGLDKNQPLIEQLQEAYEFVQLNLNLLKCCRYHHEDKQFYLQ